MVVGGAESVEREERRRACSERRAVYGDSSSDEREGSGAAEDWNWGWDGFAIVGVCIGGVP